MNFLNNQINLNNQPDLHKQILICCSLIHTWEGPTSIHLQLFNCVESTVLCLLSKLSSVARDALISFFGI